MCGVTGYLGKCACFNPLLNGLKQLQNRGYDSAGICTIEVDDKTDPVELPETEAMGFYIEQKYVLTTSKFASTETETAIEKVEKCRDTHNSSVGIAHTRWSTHGPKTDVNAHPHMDMRREISLVHNGIIENYQSLKDSLIEKGYEFKSETDTEVIVNLISYEYTKGSETFGRKESVKNAIMSAVSKLSGTYALCIVSTHTPNSLYCIRSGSPLLIGMTDHFAMVTSEKSAFENKLTNYRVINNNNLCILQLTDGIVTFESENPNAFTTLKLEGTESDGLGDFRWWTEKEINEQVHSSMRALTNGGRLKSESQVRLGGIESTTEVQELMRLEHLILLGCGTSYHAGLIGSNFLKKFCNFNTVQVIDGAELTEEDIPKKGKTGFVLLSQSGETRDLFRCIQLGRSKNIYLIGIVNVVDSLIARDVDCGIYLNAGREVAVASTKSFTSQVIVLMLLALWFSQKHELNKMSTKAKIVKDLRNISAHIKKTIEISEAMCDKLVPLFDGWNSCFLLGKGGGEGIAREGALKIKEVSYIHAEGYSASALKHGPFALLKKEFPVIIIALNDEHFEKCINAMIEIRSRGANVILITNVEKDSGRIKKEKTSLLENSLRHANHVIHIPSEGKWIGEVLSIIPIQVLAYRLALARGLNPDLPRNLAKVVTVD